MQQEDHGNFSYSLTDRLTSLSRSNFSLLYLVTPLKIVCFSIIFSRYSILPPMSSSFAELEINSNQR